MSSPTIKQLGKYRIDGLVGQGNMGVVYKAFDVDIARPVALKVLHQHLTDGDSAEEMAQRFKQEAQAAARCLHANIVTVFDYGVADNAQFIAMEFVQGTNLRTMLKYEKKLPPSQAIDVSRQILCALEYAHGNGVIHRDIKPANIMLTHQGQVKVADFGIAKLDSSELTSAGVVIGTPSYMSPEGRQGRTVDAKSDLYATGLVLYEMLSGLRPLPNQDLIPTLRINLYEMARDQQVIDQLYDLLMRVLAERPEARVQTARDFIADLDRIKLPEEEEDTGENTLVRTLVNVQARLPQPATADEAPSVPQQTGDTFAPAVLEPILQELTRLLGPMAQRLLKRAVQSSTNLAALIEALAQEIPNETERKQFIARMGKREATGSGTGSGKQKTGEGSGSAGATPGVRLLLPDEKITQLSKLLAEYVGPLATHISKRAAAQSASWSDLGGQLARHIPNESEQAAFLKRFQVLETQ